MVRRDLAARGIHDGRVLKAMGTVPREAFVPERRKRSAYEDRPLPIGGGQTISQPYIVALMAQAAAIEPGDRVLEVGTGSGYGAAVLSHLASHVHTVERLAELAESAAAALSGYSNVEVHLGDGTGGWEDGAPYDAIVVTAAGTEVPEALTAPGTGRPARRPLRDHRPGRGRVRAPGGRRRLSGAGQLASILAFSAANSSSVNTPLACSSPSLVSCSTTSTCGGAAGAAAGGG